MKFPLVPILVSLTATAFAATPVIPPGGTIVFPADGLVKMGFRGKDYADYKVVPVQGMPFKEAIQVDTKLQPLKFYNVAVNGQVTAPVKKGDSLLVSFYARCVGQGNNDTGQGDLVFTMIKSKGESLGKYVCMPGSDWQQYFYAFQVPDQIEPTDAHPGLCFGAMVQTLEVGGLQVLNYGTAKMPAQLPQTEITYAGREPDAAWRKEADARIEKIRKGDFTVVVKNAAGQPVPNAAVEVKMTRHAFSFGAAITSRAFDDTPATTPLLENHKVLFNQGLPVTSFVWSIYETPQGEAAADKFMKYFADHKMATRGHVLVWERANVMPPDVAAMMKNKDAEKLRQRVTEHIKSLVTKYKGRMTEWVVENEAVDNSEFRKILGPASIADWFKIAREADPSAKLMINDNRLEGHHPDKTDRLLELCKLIKDNGGDYDIIGIQGHFGSIPIPPATVLQHFDKLAATGKELSITEYDFDSTDERLKADYTRDFLTMVFAHPSFTGFTMWRFWDGKPEYHESVVFANDWTLRPSGQVYKDLVLKKWWTDENGTTCADGKFSGRGFYGDYDISASAGDKSQTVKTVFAKGQPNSIEITLP
ncbi:endo-1,4-beta-xylanase [soil metagenome]